MEHGNSICGLKDCVPILKGIAIVSGAMFAGISIYIQRVEHPARSTLPTEFAVSQFRESIKKAAPVQTTLGALSTAASLLTFGSIVSASCRVANKTIVKATEDSVRHCCQCNGLGWLLGGGLMGLVFPYTLFIIAPTAQKLLAPNVDTFSDDTRQLLAKWGELHAVRSVLSVSAVAIMTWKVFKHSHGILYARN